MKFGLPIRTLVLLSLTGLGLGSAQAGNVAWSIAINAPLDHGVRLGTVISGGGHAYRQAPAYGYAPPVYVAPEPVYWPYAPVVYAPRPAPVYVQRGGYVQHGGYGQHGEYDQYGGYGQQGGYVHPRGWNKPHRHGHRHGH